MRFGSIPARERSPCSLWARARPARRMGTLNCNPSTRVHVIFASLNLFVDPMYCAGVVACLMRGARKMCRLQSLMHVAHRALLASK
eukprot:scaffold270176_cov35-Tisochrysis_lutea.AAC.1